MRREDPRPFPFDEIPVDQRGELHQRMAMIKQTDQAWAQKVILMRPIPAAENHIEIDLAGGHRMRISGSYDPEALARLIRGLTA